MSNVFYSAWLCRRGSLGWASVEARFGRRPIRAHIQLSAFYAQNGDRFVPFARQYAQAYIQTELTPVTPPGYAIPNKETDNTVALTTDHLTFWLQADGVVTTSAVGLIHDMRTGASFDEERLEDLEEFAVFDRDGAVMRTHRVARLDGAPALDTEEIAGRVLERTRHEIGEGRDLYVTRIDLTGMPDTAAYRVDTRTRRAVPD